MLRATRILLQTTPKLPAFPIVDATEFLSTPFGALPSIYSSQTTKNAAEELFSAASASGFFYLRNEHLPETLFVDTKTQLEKFFALPLVHKQRCHVSKQTSFRGYSGMYEQGHYGVDDTDIRTQNTSENNTNNNNNSNTNNNNAEEQQLVSSLDHKEAFHMGPSNAGPSTNSSLYPELFGENVFPFPHPPLPKHEFDPVVFRDTLTKYYETVRLLSDKLFVLFALSLQLEDPRYFVDRAVFGMDSMNCLYYPPYAQNASAKGKRQMGINAHTDFECFTILWQQPDGPTSLEVLVENNHDNNNNNDFAQQSKPALSWQLVPPLENTFVINVGDLLSRWCGGVFRSSVHRSRTQSDQSRFAIAYFRGCDFDTRLECVLSRGGRVAPKKVFPVVVAGEHMIRRVRGANEVYEGK